MTLLKFCEALEVFSMGAICAILVMPKPTEPIVPECPDRGECWKFCASMAEIATDTAVSTCTTALEKEVMLRECDDAMWVLREDMMDHWEARIDARIDEISWALHTENFDALDALEGEGLP